MLLKVMNVHRLFINTVHLARCNRVRMKTMEWPLVRKRGQYVLFTYSYCLRYSGTKIKYHIFQITSVTVDIHCNHFKLNNRCCLVSFLLYCDRYSYPC